MIRSEYAANVLLAQVPTTNITWTQPSRCVRPRKSWLARLIAKVVSHG